MPQIGYQECSGCGLMFAEATETMEGHECEPSIRYTLEVNIGGWLRVQWAPYFATEDEALEWAHKPIHDWEGPVRVIQA